MFFEDTFISARESAPLIVRNKNERYIIIPFILVYFKIFIVGVCFKLTSPCSKAVRQINQSFSLIQLFVFSQNSRYINITKNNIFPLLEKTFQNCFTVFFCQKFFKKFKSHIKSQSFSTEIVYERTNLEFFSTSAIIRLREIIQLFITQNRPARFSWYDALMNNTTQLLSLPRIYQIPRRSRCDTTSRAITNLR